MKVMLDHDYEESESEAGIIIKQITESMGHKKERSIIEAKLQLSMNHNKSSEKPRLEIENEVFFKDFYILKVLSIFYKVILENFYIL